MADVVVAAPETPKKVAKVPKAKKAKPVASHPKISVMVNEAITNLKERGGSSLQAIKKYIANHYKVDIERLSPFIKKYLKSAVANKELVQTKGKGASGSFKLIPVVTMKTHAKPKIAKPVKKPKMSAPVSKKPDAKIKKASVKKVTKKPKAEKKSKAAKAIKKPKVKAATKSKPKPKKAKISPKKTAKSAPKSQKGKK